MNPLVLRLGLVVAIGLGLGCSSATRAVSPGGAGADGQRPPAGGSFGTAGGDTLYRLREGIERFLITDINNPGASAQAQSTFTASSGRLRSSNRYSLPRTMTASRRALSLALPLLALSAAGRHPVYGRVDVLTVLITEARDLSAADLRP